LHPNKDLKRFQANLTLFFPSQTTREAGGYQKFCEGKKAPEGQQAEIIFQGRWTVVNFTSSNYSGIR
jgi:hypothetical protein